MKSRKLRLSIFLFAISLFAILFIPHSVEASTPLNPNWYIGINEYRSNTTPENMGYSIKKPNNHLTIDQGYKIWEIVKYNSNNESDTNYSTALTLYCVKAGVGFRELSTDTSTGTSKPAIKRATYTTSYNLVKDKAELLSLKDRNSTLYSLVSTDNYYGILALADLMYIPEESTAQEKTDLINAALKANNVNAANYNTALTDEDVDAVQQAALWYFTNYDGGDSYTNVFNQLGKKTWLFYKTTSMSEYTSLQDYNPIVDGNKSEAGLDRDEQACYLYDYLINTAKANISKYKDGTITSKSKITLYTDPNVEDHQPIISIEKEKPFDLALRKYITKVTTKGGTTTDLSNSTSTTRVPSINTSTIDTEFTATYKHRKDPVTVKTGDVVTYNISVYNEGSKAGRATKIVDQLPTGLVFTSLSDSAKNIYDATWDATTNSVTFTRKSSNTDNLAAYTNGNLKSETIEFTCTVTKKASNTNKEILTNVAWISEEYNSVDNLTITKTVGDDRDSEPDTKPSVNKDNMSDYKGNTSNKNELGDSNYFYKGEQDDDDFEKLVLQPNEFDLKLIKRISEVNNVKVPERIKSVDTSKLNTVGSDGKLITTATYKMDKNPVAVKKGDIIKYGIRVYNEGATDGYASEISEDVPEGLEFVWSEKLEDELDKDTTLSQTEKDAILYNQLIWTPKTINKDTNKIEVVTTNYLAKGEGAEKAGTGTNLIKAFDSATQTLDYKDVYVYMKVVSDNIGGTTIRNEAAITKDSDSDGNDITDRDSTPEDWKKEDDNKYYDDDKKWPSYKEDDEDYDNVILQNFDLALRKFIIAVSPDVEISNSEYLKDSNGNYTRAPQVDTSKLNTIGTDGKLVTTATYNHPKTPVEVSSSDIVVYMLRVYNEGEIDGYATEIKDHLPPTLEFVNSEFNTKYNWKVSEDGRTVSTDYLKDSKVEKYRKDANGKIVLNYVEIPIMCKVKNTVNADEIITNIADITKFTDGDKNTIKDRDSEEDNVNLPEDSKLPSYKDDEKGNYVPGQQDDDDFEKVKVKPFDLALRKFIIAVSSDTEISDNEYLKDSKGNYTRAPQVDTSKLNTTGTDGKLITTATYNHPKTPVEVNKNDVVVYMLRVYNEGEVDGYATEIKDHLPSTLEFVDGEFNTKYNWKVSEDGRTVSTDYLKDSKVEKYKKDANGKIVLNYVEVPIMCKLKDTAKVNEVITNIADITKFTDGNKNTIKDRDSEEDNVNLPEDNQLPSYKDDETGDYVPGQQDDDDFEKVVIKPFDLALRKFITKVNNTDVNTRIPQVKYDAENNKITYEHTKDPVDVVTSDIVTYTIRVFNEGMKDGYAAEVSDDMPAGLEFLPDNETNKDYRWVMYDKDGNKTDDVSKAVKIRTDYLSKEQGEAKMKEDSSLKENPYLLKAFDGSKEISDENPDYLDVKVAFKVVEPNTSDKIIVNSAQISKDTDKDGKDIDDIDSIPDEWNDGEDDQDREYIKLNYFDLALRKWVTQAIVIENGKETVTQTGHTPEQDPEPIVKVELNRKKLSKVTVKFRYSIRVTNEGDIAGYAKEVKDYVPAGLKFVAADNPGWTDLGNNVITTNLLADKLLQPGESADVQVLLTWINGQNNMGLKTNVAEISKDYNDRGVPDRDSTPDNKKDGEDDIDDAPVMLSVSTGKVKTYFALGFTVLVMLAGGIVLIKKFVL